MFGKENLPMKLKSASRLEFWKNVSLKPIITSSFFFVCVNAAIKLKPREAVLVRGIALKVNPPSASKNPVKTPGVGVNVVVVVDIFWFLSGKMFLKNEIKPLGLFSKKRLLSFFSL